VPAVTSAAGAFQRLGAAVSASLFFFPGGRTPLIVQWLGSQGENAVSQILHWLGLKPSAQSVDYVENKKQFHLFSLLTEQRHPRTWNLSFAVQSDTAAGLRMLLSVDRDISARLAELRRSPSALEQAANALEEAIRSGRRIYVYGCGATGRLAKQMESAFWRPFWRKVRRHPCWSKLEPGLPGEIENLVIGEMTGGDRALVSSLEGFEDLPIIGRLQLEDHGVRAGDIVVCVTEGGETSSVIGTMLAVLDQYGGAEERRRAGARERLYFVYNNPDELLRPFARSAAIIDNPDVTRINLTTGPQAITGSTRMQATTIETFVLGALFEEAIARILRRRLTVREVQELGFAGDSGVAGRLASFDAVKGAVDEAVQPAAEFTALEADTYRQGRFATYFAARALITVFIDNTERSPTFRLFPLDKAGEDERRCWVQVWTPAADYREAWQSFLGRPFRGLRESFYRRPLESEVSDPYLRAAALRSLADAGDEQERAYDFSFAGHNVERRAPAAGDLAVAVAMDAEAAELARGQGGFGAFASLARGRGARLALVTVTGRSGPGADEAASMRARPPDVRLHIALDCLDDPLTLRRQIALKMLLNAHSTAVMAALGRVVGNTMTSVSPSNLKLIGRATYLIMTHVNDTLGCPEWSERHGPAEPVTFAEANAVLFDAMDYVREHPAGQTAEVALSIVRILEAARRRAFVSWDEARAVVDAQGLAAYLLAHNPALGRSPEP